MYNLFRNLFCNQFGWVLSDIDFWWFNVLKKLTIFCLRFWIGDRINLLLNILWQNKSISEAVCYTHGQLSKSISTIPRFKPMEARSFLKETCMSFLESNQSAIVKESRDVFCIYNYFHYTSYFFPKVYYLLFKYLKSGPAGKVIYTKYSKQFK